MEPAAVAHGQIAAQIHQRELCALGAGSGIGGGPEHRQAVEAVAGVEQVGIAVGGYLQARVIDSSLSATLTLSSVPFQRPLLLVNSTSRSLPAGLPASDWMDDRPR